MAKEDLTDWNDVQIPAHLKKIKTGANIVVAIPNQSNIANQTRTEDMMNQEVAQSIKDRIFDEQRREVEKPPSQMTQRSGVTIAKPFMT